MRLRTLQPSRRRNGSARWFRPHRLSVNIALAAAMPVLLIGMAALAVWAPEFLLPFLAFSALLFVSTYFAARHFVAARLEIARSTLRRTRKYKFGKLAEADFPRGDELNELMRQVYRTGQVLEREIRQLRKVADYRRAFIGNVSHELKTPIFAIQGYAETLMEGALEDPEVNRVFVEKIVRNANRLSNLTGDLIEISRIETGELKMSFESFRLQDLISEICDSLESAAHKQRIDVSVEIPAELPAVTGDPQHIHQVIVNLLDNAIKYTDAGGSVRISAESVPGGVEISISDTGIGMAKKYIPRVTERFFRIDKSRSRSAGGTGLGLAIVKHILSAHSQELKISSKPDRGSTFRFRLPAAENGIPLSGTVETG